MKIRFTISLVATALLVGECCGQDLSGQHGPPIPRADSTPEDGLAVQLSSRLKTAGWSDATAQAVVALNLDRYRLLRETAEVVLERELQAYESLRPDGRVALLLEKHPEMAGVLLLARDPAMVAKGILGCEQEEDQVRIISSFVKYTDPDEISLWATAVGDHGRCIAGLLRRCQAWPRGSS